MKLFSRRDAARMLNVSVGTLDRWRLLGSGPVYRKLNGRVLYADQDLQRFVDNRARVSTRAEA